MSLTSSESPCEFRNPFRVQREGAVDVADAPDDRGLSLPGPTDSGIVKPSNRSIDQPSGSPAKTRQRFVILLAAHLERVFEEPDEADGCEFHAELLPELAASSFLAGFAELDPAPEWPVVVGAVILIDEPCEERSRSSSCTKQKAHARIRLGLPSEPDYLPPVIVEGQRRRRCIGRA